MWGIFQSLFSLIKYVLVCVNYFYRPSFSPDPYLTSVPGLEPEGLIQQQIISRNQSIKTFIRIFQLLELKKTHVLFIPKWTMTGSGAISSGQQPCKGEMQPARTGTARVDIRDKLPREEKKIQIKVLAAECVSGEILFLDSKQLNYSLCRSRFNSAQGWSRKSERWERKTDSRSGKRECTW